MSKGSNKVLKEELTEIRALAVVAQAYELTKFVIDAPSTLTGMVEMKMFERKMHQKDLAVKLKMSEAKLSLILNGKQKPGVDFLKAIYSELKIDAEFILEHV